MSISDGIWMPAFLESYIVKGNIYEASLEAGVSSSVVRKAIRDNPQFKEEFDDAQSDFADRLEGEAGRRALSDSDMLLEKMLKAHKPDKYKDGQIINNGEIKAFIGFTPDDWDDVEIEVQEEEFLIEE